MYLAWKEIRRSKGRFFFMMVIIALLAYLVFFVSGLANGLSKDNASAIEKYSNETFILQKDADQRISRSALSTDTVDRLRDKLGSGNATILNILNTTVNRSGKQEKIDLTLFSLDAGRSFRPSLTAGKYPANHSTVDLIIDQSIERSGIHLHDTIKDQQSGLTFKVVGFTKNATFSHMPVAYLNQNQWALLMNKDGFSADQAVHSAVMTPFSVQKTNRLIHHIDLEQTVTSVSLAHVVESLPGYSEEQGSLDMMISFLFIISVFILGVFFYIITAQKDIQFGILKAIGTDTGYLVRSLIFQTLMMLLISLAVSLLLTYLTTIILPSGMPFSLAPGTITGRLAGFIAISIVSILLSIRQVIKVNALKAIEGR